MRQSQAALPTFVVHQIPGLSHLLRRLSCSLLLCAVRLGLNKRVSPQTRDIVFGGAVLLALAHAGYVMSGDSTM